MRITNFTSILPFLFVTFFFVPSPSFAQVPSPPAPDPEPDPTCARGVMAGMACCPSICGLCGGMGCASRPGGVSCCTFTVMTLMRDCNLEGPPCTKGLPPSPSPMESVSPSPAMFSPMPSPSSVLSTPVPSVSSSPDASPIPSMAIDASPTPSMSMTPSMERPKWINIDSEILHRPIKRAEACFVMARGKGYLLGGRGAAFETDIFDPKTRTWTKGSAPPFEFHHGSCVPVGSQIFIPVSFSGPFPVEAANDKLLIYNVLRDRWVTRPGLPPARNRAAAAAVLRNKKIWVAGGSSGGHGPGSKTFGFFDYYDLVTKKWVTNLPSMPIVRDHHGGAIVKGRFCVAGGRKSNAENFFGAVTVATLCYNFNRKVWINVRAPMPQARANSAYARTCAGEMMVAGGEGKRLKALGRVDVFNGSRWRRIPNLAFGRHGTGLAVSRCACGQIFIAGGQGRQADRQPLDSTEVYLSNGMNVICKRY